MGPRREEEGPAFYLFLSWMAAHIKHRDTESNYDDNKVDITCSLSTHALSNMQENVPPPVYNSLTLTSEDEKAAKHPFIFWNS